MRFILAFALAAIAAFSGADSLASSASWQGGKACSPSVASASVDSVVSEHVRLGIEKEFDVYDVPASPGAAIAVYQGGRTVYCAGFGQADLEAETPITTQTAFHVASISKQFTAFAIALLVREGKVDPQADVRAYLPWVPDFGSTIRIRHLIAHTSGLRNQWTLFAMGGQELGNRLRQRQILNLVSRQTALDFPPGTQYAYSNTNYTLLAEIVQRVSGQTLRAFTDSRIFKPLGMTHTMFFDDVTEVVPGRANSYVSKNGRWSRALLNFDNVGATGLLSSVEDLAKWAANFAHPRVGDAALIDMVTRPASLDDGTPLDYAYALQRTDLGGREVIMHSGSDAGFNALFVYYPKHDLAIVTTANTPMNLRAKTVAVANLFLPWTPASLAYVEPASTRPPGPAVLPTPPESSLQKYLGSYRSAELDQTYDISLKDGELVLDGLWNEAPVALSYIGGDSFSAPLWYLARLRFTLDSSSRAQTLFVDGGRARNVRFDRLD